MGTHSLSLSTFCTPHSIAYGKTARGLAQDLSVWHSEATQILEKWYGDRKEVRRWQRRQMVEALDSGYSTSLIGRGRRLFDPLHDLCRGDAAMHRDFVHFVRCAFNLNGDGHGDDEDGEDHEDGRSLRERQKGGDRKVGDLWRSFMKERRRKEGERSLPGAAWNGAAPLNLNKVMRQSINSPVQSSAADLVVKAMLNLRESEELKELGYSLLLQIHDELILEGPKCNVERAKLVVKECMETPWNGMKRDVVFKVDVKHSDNWFDAK